MTSDRETSATPADPPEWAMREAQRIINGWAGLTGEPDEIVMQESIAKAEIASALVTARREAITSLIDIVTRYEVNGDLGCPEMMAEVAALIDKDPTPAALSARAEEEAP